MIEREELNEDGTVDDVVGEGSWQLEQMQDDHYTLVTDQHVFSLVAEDGELKVTRRD